MPFKSDTLGVYEKQTHENVTLAFSSHQQSKLHGRNSWEMNWKTKQRMPLCTCINACFSHILKRACSFALSTEARKGIEEAWLSELDISVQKKRLLRMWSGSVKPHMKSRGWLWNIHCLFHYKNWGPSNDATKFKAKRKRLFFLKWMVDYIISHQRTSWVPYVCMESRGDWRVSCKRE